ncbi:hemin ABC transporter substrate-binding protein [Tessaracoccus sp. OH4464_COT-324]|uniref:heme/hemin ABC transporter substrate-binding protein n=1 Tax=Tessaracoccus sp. OH4464_COT-324 TaxID=2491059 RepID=UPI000F644A14|nr:ABC transporter substrate-binding protein [Tessaracoccus sp. OH4464_COT-324]RRD47915.1 hypothetical protein EII42_01320 [Tessaracoccus sp. OH4464_COT-324]
MLDKRPRPVTRVAGRGPLGLFAALLAVFALAACSSGSFPSISPTVAASTPQTTPAETSQAAASAAPSSAAPELPDPRTITGPSHVSVAQTIKPVAKRPTQSFPVSFTDSAGQAHEITDASRVLLLDISGTYSQIAVGLGLEHVLVGRTASDLSPELAQLPLVTVNGHELSGEAILALAPTLVVTDTTLGPPEVVEQLRGSGIPVVTLDSGRRMDTVERDIVAISSLLGVPAEGRKLADAALADIEAARQEIAQYAPSQPMRTIVLYIRGTSGVFFIFGKGYGTAALLEAVGAEDSASTAGIEDVKPANAEALAALDPEMILVMSGGLTSTGGLEGLLARPGVAQTTAGTRQRIIDVEDGLLLSFGPNTGNVIRALAKAMYQP